MCDVVLGARRIGFCSDVGSIKSGGVEPVSVLATLLPHPRRNASRYSQVVLLPVE